MRALLTILALWFAWADLAYRWSSPASSTENQIRNLNIAITLFHSEFGRFPAQQTYSDELVAARMWDSSRKGPILDDWNRPILYRVPGKHGPFDIYSMGRDAIDDDGTHDDISNWAGVNDGYYWKSDWPAGRSVIRWAKIIGLGSLLLGFFFPLRLVVPMAGAVIAFGYMVGSYMLLHPGIAPEYNAPLVQQGAAAKNGLLFMVAAFTVSYWRYAHRKRAAAIRPTEAQTQT